MKNEFLIKKQTNLGFSNKFIGIFIEKKIISNKFSAISSNQLHQLIQFLFNSISELFQSVMIEIKIDSKPFYYKFVLYFASI